MSARARRLTARVHVGGRVEIVVPVGVKARAVRDFVQRFTPWIDRKVAAMQCFAEPAASVPTRIDFGYTEEHFDVHWQQAPRRELSLEEVRSIIDATGCEIEIFVHGALCVAYSGQCFSSEAWGGRSANRGQCAQACRLPYQMIVDGRLKPLADARYLLSPGDLYALEQVPQIVEIGVAAMKKTSAPAPCSVTTCDSTVGSEVS